MAENGNIVNAILELKDREPFQAFRIVLTSGDRYLIENGDNLVEMKNEFFYALPGGENFVFVRKAEIVAVEGRERGNTRGGRRKAS